MHLKESYGITESPRQEFVKILVDMKTTEAMAARAKKLEKAEEIKVWFDSFEGLLRRIFHEDALQLVFDEDTFAFSIHLPEKPPFDFNTLSSGYGAVLDIIVDLMIRMQRHSQRRFAFDMAGIVLIDEVETHLHLDLQREVLDLLTTTFPNIQFILSTHSPFILNALDKTVIYDLQRRLEVTGGLQDVSYAGIVESYFKADTMSQAIRKQFLTYQALVQKDELSDEEFAEIFRLTEILDEIPDFLSIDIGFDYHQLKLEFESKVGSV